MKRMIYQVSIGKPSKLYKTCIKSVSEYCKKYDIEHVIQTRPILNIRPDPFNTGRSDECVSRPVPLPIFEKENALDWFKKGYDQIAVIDADIFIRDTAPNIFEDLAEEYDFGAVAEREMPITDQYKNKILNYSMMQYSNLHGKVADFDPTGLGYSFMNMGVMVMNKSITEHLKGQTAREFLERPEFKDFIDGVGNWKWSTDQTLLNTWIRQSGMNIERLHWKWNGLYTVRNILVLSTKSSQIFP